MGEHKYVHAACKSKTPLRFMQINKIICTKDLYRQDTFRQPRNKAFNPIALGYMNL